MHTNPVYLVFGCTVFAGFAQVLIECGALHPMPAIDLADLSTVLTFVVALLGNWPLLLGYEYPCLQCVFADYGAAAR